MLNVRLCSTFVVCVEGPSVSVLKSVCVKRPSHSFCLWHDQGLFRVSQVVYKTIPFGGFPQNCTALYQFPPFVLASGAVLGGRVGTGKRCTAVPRYRHSHPEGTQSRRYVYARKVRHFCLGGVPFLNRRAVQPQGGPSTLGEVSNTK